MIFDRLGQFSYLILLIMEEQANQFLTRVRFLSLVRANITYLSDENQFYFDNVIQPLYHCFEGNDAKLVLE